MVSQGPLSGSHRYQELLLFLLIELIFYWVFSTIFVRKWIFLVLHFAKGMLQTVLVFTVANLDVSLYDSILPQFQPREFRKSRS